MLKFISNKKCKLKQGESILHFLDQQKLKCWRRPSVMVKMWRHRLIHPPQGRIWQFLVKSTLCISYDLMLPPMSTMSTYSKEILIRAQKKQTQSWSKHCCGGRKLPSCPLLGESIGKMWSKHFCYYCYCCNCWNFLVYPFAFLSGLWALQRQELNLVHLCTEVIIHC